MSGRIKCPFGKDGCVLSPETGRDAPSHSLQSWIPQETSSRRYRSRRTTDTNVTIFLRSEIERFHTLDDLPSRSLFEEFALSYDRLCPCALQYRDFDHDCDPGRDRNEGNKRKASENGPDRASKFLLDL